MMRRALVLLVLGVGCADPSFLVIDPGTYDEDTGAELADVDQVDGPRGDVISDQVHVDQVVPLEDSGEGESSADVDGEEGDTSSSTDAGDASGDVADDGPSCVKNLGDPCDKVKNPCCAHWPDYFLFCSTSGSSSSGTCAECVKFLGNPCNKFTKPCCDLPGGMHCSGDITGGYCKPGPCPPDCF